MTGRGDRLSRGVVGLRNLDILRGSLGRLVLAAGESRVPAVAVGTAPLGPRALRGAGGASTTATTGAGGHCRAVQAVVAAGSDLGVTHGTIVLCLGRHYNLLANILSVWHLLW